MRDRHHADIRTNGRRACGHSKQRGGRAELVEPRWHSTPVWDRQLVGSCRVTQGAQLSALGWPRGVGWRGGRRVAGKRHTHIYNWYMEKEMAAHSSVLAWRIPGTEEPGRLPSMGSHRVGHDWSDLAATACCYTAESNTTLEWKWRSLSHVQLCDPTDCTVHGILQARILQWAAFPFSRGSSQSQDLTQVSHIAGRFFISWATRGAQEHSIYTPILKRRRKGKRRKSDLGGSIKHEALAQSHLAGATWHLEVYVTPTGCGPVCDGSEVGTKYSNLSPLTPQCLTSASHNSHWNPDSRGAYVMAWTVGLPRAQEGMEESTG